VPLSDGVGNGTAGDRSPFIALRAKLPLDAAVIGRNAWAIGSRMDSCPDSGTVWAGSTAKAVSLRN